MEDPKNDHFYRESFDFFFSEKKKEKNILSTEGSGKEITEKNNLIFPLRNTSTIFVWGSIFLNRTPKNGAPFFEDMFKKSPEQHSYVRR